jgi:hypothetical protein
MSIYNALNTAIYSTLSGGTALINAWVARLSTTSKRQTGLHCPTWFGAIRRAGTIT